ncbi:biotin transporter BioY [Zongyangia hominis]|uniref:Biotin transporter n=1 Tax=Zongyangia hominis TaxID=2763677 RepID=A0A926EDB9_9FIRM|nr:biotin transporter BioY [Zongyangia hominis]MBC8570319.1 biotin transporter BioY [Zongyangia hominis]
MTTKSRTQKITFCALFAALTAILSQLAIPIGTVPINLAMLAVFIAGGVLGPVYGTISMVVYVALGAVGVPVFAMFTGGVAILVGPTGGYIAGYIAAAWLTGLLISKGSGKAWQSAAAMVAGLALCYLLGTAWFMVSTGTPLAAALLACVAPFLPGDAIKIAAATLVVRVLKKQLAW